MKKACGQRDPRFEPRRREHDAGRSRRDASPGPSRRCARLPSKRVNSRLRRAAMQLAPAQVAGRVQPRAGRAPCGGRTRARLRGSRRARCRRGTTRSVCTRRARASRARVARQRLAPCRAGTETARARCSAVGHRAGSTSTRSPSVAASAASSARWSASIRSARSASTPRKRGALVVAQQRIVTRCGREHAFGQPAHEHAVEIGAEREADRTDEHALPQPADPLACRGQLELERPAEHGHRRAPPRPRRVRPAGRARLRRDGAASCSNPGHDSRPALVADPAPDEPVRPPRLPRPRRRHPGRLEIVGERIHERAQLRDPSPLRASQSRSPELRRVGVEQHVPLLEAAHDARRAATRAPTRPTEPNARCRRASARPRAA